MRSFLVGQIARLAELVAVMWAIFGRPHWAPRKNESVSRKESQLLFGHFKPLLGPTDSRDWQIPRTDT